MYTYVVPPQGPTHTYIYIYMNIYIYILCFTGICQAWTKLPKSYHVGEPLPSSVFHPIVCMWLIAKSAGSIKVQKDFQPLGSLARTLTHTKVRTEHPNPRRPLWFAKVMAAMPLWSWLQYVQVRVKRVWLVTAKLVQTKSLIGCREWDVQLCPAVGTTWA